MKFCPFQNPSVKKIVWSGSGKAITKTVTCAEIMKRKIKVWVDKRRNHC
jgi:DNA-binding protein